MEIFNEILTAISTQNEGLVNIITIPLFFVENFLIMTLSISILNISISKKQKSIYVIILSIIGIFTNNFLGNPINIIINYFIMILMANIIFKISFLKSCISIFFSGIIFNIIGAFILNPYLNIFGIDANQLTNIPIYRIMYIFIIYTLIFILSILIKHRGFKINFIENIDNKNKLIIIANIVFGILTFIVQSVITFYYIDTLPIFITFLSALTLVAYFSLSIYSLTKFFTLIVTSQKLESAEEYNNTLHILHDNVRGFKHDFDNIVTTIGGYIRTNDMAGLKNYYLQLEDDCQRVNNLYLLNPEIVNNDGIYNLLTKKYYEADSKDIKVNITFLLDLSTLKMKIYEFARILGILLDNAIEASSECNEKIIDLTFRNDSKNSRQLIIIENTYKNKNIDTEKIFEKGVSEKENHTGLGLWEVRKIIKKTNNVNLYTNKSDKFFTQQLEIYY